MLDSTSPSHKRRSQTSKNQRTSSIIVESASILSCQIEGIDVSKAESPSISDKGPSLCLHFLKSEKLKVLDFSHQSGVQYLNSSKHSPVNKHTLQTTAKDQAPPWGVLLSTLESISTAISHQADKHDVQVDLLNIMAIDIVGIDKKLQSLNDLITRQHNYTQQVNCKCTSVCENPQKLSVILSDILTEVRAQATGAHKKEKETVRAEEVSLKKREASQQKDTNNTQSDQIPIQEISVLTVTSESNFKGNDINVNLTSNRTTEKII